MINLTVIFCEGKHDSALLSLIIKNLLGFRGYKEAIKDYPYPLDSVKRTLINKPIDDIKLFELDIWVPVIYEKDNTLLAIYEMGGKDKYKTLDSSDNKAVKLLTSLFVDFYIQKRVKRIRSVDNLDSMKHNVIERVNFGLFMDLDDDKEDELKNEIINSYKKYFPEIANVQLYEVFKSKDINLGLYFFNKDIDNLIMKLFLQYNGKIFDYIDEYIDKSPAKTPNIFDKDKAKISIAGQFIKKCTGYANSVIIRDSGYINETNLNNSIECKNIVKFLSKLMDINLV